jgi:hypothetical protein
VKTTVTVSVRASAVANGHGAAVTALKRFGASFAYELPAVLDQPAQHRERLGGATTSSPHKNCSAPRSGQKPAKRYTSVCVHDQNRFLTGL